MENRKKVDHCSRYPEPVYCERQEPTAQETVNSEQKEPGVKEECFVNPVVISSSALLESSLEDNHKSKKSQQVRNVLLFRHIFKIQ